MTAATVNGPSHGTADDRALRHRWAVAVVEGTSSRAILTPLANLLAELERRGITQVHMPAGPDWTGRRRLSATNADAQRFAALGVRAAWTVDDENAADIRFVEVEPDWTGDR